MSALFAYGCNVVMVKDQVACTQLLHSKTIYLNFIDVLHAGVAMYAYYIIILHDTAASMH